MNLATSVSLWLQVQAFVSHPLHPPESPRRQRQAAPANGGVLPWGVHGTPDGAAVQFRHPKRIPCRTKAAEHLAVLVAGLGCGKHWWSERRHARVHDGRDGELGALMGIAGAPIEHHAALANTVSDAALH